MQKIFLKKIAAFALVLTAASVLFGCGSEIEGAFPPGDTVISLSDDGITVLTEDKEVIVTSSKDIIYYMDLEKYLSGNPYGEGTESERHSAAEAKAHTVVNIRTPGRYILRGKLSKGQIRVDLGEDAKKDPNAVVTLVLDGVDITCEVAPAILFLNVYECDLERDKENATYLADTANAGANIVLAEGSENNISGSHVAKIFKDKEGEKKLWKQDGAIYSYMSLNVAGEGDGSGVLNLTADNEGLDTEMHLTLNSGNVNIFSQNDGINTNEDGLSVTTVNGGTLHIVAGLGAEGDGIDSNGWLVINGGTVVSAAKPHSDAGLDSSMGSYINGGTVVAFGAAMDWAESDSKQVTLNLQFAENKAADAAITVVGEDGMAVFAYDPSKNETLGELARVYGGAIISSPAFTVGAGYNIYSGGEIKGSSKLGIYSEVESFKGGIMQSYSGTDVTMRGPGGKGGKPGGEMPKMPDAGGREDGMMPHMPGGELPKDIPAMPDIGEGAPAIPDLSVMVPATPDGKRPEGGIQIVPDGATPPAGATPPDGATPPAGAGAIPIPEGILNAEANTVFYMQDKVNFFSGVADVK